MRLDFSTLSLDRDSTMGTCSLRRDFAQYRQQMVKYRERSTAVSVRGQKLNAHSPPSVRLTSPLFGSEHRPKTLLRFVRACRIQTADRGSW